MINAVRPVVWEQGQENAIEELVNLYLEICPQNEPFHFNKLRDKVNKEFPEFKKHSLYLTDFARQQMNSHNYIQNLGISRVDFLVTPFGKTVKKLGGHEVYQERNLERENQKLNFYKNISIVVNELTKSGIAQTIIAEYFFSQTEEKTKSSFFKFINKNGVDLSIALTAPAVADFYNSLPI